MGRPRVSNEKAAIHRWLKRNYPKLGVCENCGKEGKTDYAFLQHPKPYTINRDDYAELCRSCHWKLDKREPIEAERNRNKTHCAKGHLLEGENVYFRPSGGRTCLTCKRESNKRYMRRQRTYKSNKISIKKLGRLF